MIAHAKQAMVYVLIVATTFVGSWLLFGREMEAGAASAPLSEATEPAPLIFEARDRTCVYIGGQLACFCSCADLRAGCDAALAIRTEPQVIAVPLPDAGTEDRLSGTSRAVGVTETEPSSGTGGAVGVTETEPSSGSGGVVGVAETETSSAITPTTPVLSPRLGGALRDDPQEKPKCNQGVGNGPEGCDPGNSNHNQPSNDEDGGTPGSPGRQGPRDAEEGNDRPARPDKDD